MKSFLLIITLSLVPFISTTQKIIQSNYSSTKIKIDGKLDEKIWQEHLKETEFTQSSPDNGEQSTQITKIAIANDDAYFYVAADIYINKGQKINKKLSERDDGGTADYFGVIIDPFGACREGWVYLVTASNVQMDIKVTEDDSYDEWNAIWESAVEIHENHWSIEIKIPFNSLRFPKGNFENFTINFERFDSSTNENSFWNHIDENKDGTLNQFGKLTNLKNVNPPINLSFNPYISYVFEETADGLSKSTFSGGLDMKYVYNNAYTLDISLIPDFSQAPSDQQILNLSPFDIKYNENRQFFVEGTELFDKGNYLYTRRIGGEPINAYNFSISDEEEIIENPVSSNILNLMKFTGKSKNGLSIAVLNGITNKSEAVIFNSETKKSRKTITNPLTNYNAIVLDQTLKNNSSVTFINNSVIRSGSDYDANLTAGLLKLYNKNRKYSLSINTAISQKYNLNSFNPITIESETSNKSEFGHQYKASIRKVSGKLKAGFLFSLEDEKYDNNDFGFQTRNNVMVVGNYLLFAQTKPKKHFSYFHFLGRYSLRKYYSLMETESSKYDVQFYGQRKNNHRIYIETKFETKRKDFYEARVQDQVFNKANKVVTFLEYQTDQNKNLSFATYLVNNFFLNTDLQTNSTTTGYGFDYRMGEHFVFEWFQDFYFNPKSIGYLYGDEEIILFGNREIRQLENGFSIDYAVNSKLHLSTTIRHYWIQVDYNDQYTLLENGNLETNDLDIDIKEFNANFNSFNIDFLAKWQFAPGSEASIVYKLGNSNFNQETSSDYNENFNSIINEKSNHTVSFKLTYLLDFNRVKKRGEF